MSDNKGVSDPTPDSPFPECPHCVQLIGLVAQLQSQVLEFQAEVKRLHSRIRDLEAKLNTHSGNSSLPPSANPPGAPKFPPRQPTGRKPGGQPGHKGHSRARLPVGRVNEVIEYFPDDCEKCHAPLSRERGGNDPEPVWHQVAELPPVAAIVTEHQGHGRRCGDCGHVTFGKIPAAIRAHAFGPRLAAAVVFLSSRCHGGKRTVAETVQTLFGVPIALGSISNLKTEVAAALAPAHLEAEKAVREAPVKNADETGWSIAGKLCWLWMAATKLVACFKITAGRGKADFRKLLGEKVDGVVGSDRWHAYNFLELPDRQLCRAHLKRDFQKWLDRGGEGVPVGQAGLAAVKRLFELWRDFRQGSIDRSARTGGRDETGSSGTSTNAGGPAALRGQEGRPVLSKNTGGQPGVVDLHADRGRGADEQSCRTHTAPGGDLAENQLRQPQRKRLPLRRKNPDGGADTPAAKTRRDDLPGTGDRIHPREPTDPIAAADGRVNGYDDFNSLLTHNKCTLHKPLRATQGFPEPISRKCLVYILRFAPIKSHQFRAMETSCILHR